jgi:heat shock protein HtpX
MYALMFAVGINLISYWFSDKIALAMTGAREVSVFDAPELYSLVTNLAAQAGIPRPRVYVIDSISPNAFATGRDPAHAVVAVTRGIVAILNRSELTAVISHELGHIRNRDTLIMTVTAAIAGAIASMAHMPQWALPPMIAMLIQLAISRAREFEADITGARLSRQPLALASALERLDATVHARPMDVSPAAAHLFIVNPWCGNPWLNLFRTHPTTEARVARIRSLARAAGH